MWRMCSLAHSIYYSNYVWGLSVTPVLWLHSDQPTHGGDWLNNLVFLPQCSVFCWFWFDSYHIYIVSTCTHSMCEPEVSRLGQYNNFRLTIVTGCYCPSDTGPSTTPTAEGSCGIPILWCTLAPPVIEFESPWYPLIFNFGNRTK
jgi:hypothetical protein